MTENIELYQRLGWRETHRRTEHGFQRVFFSKPADEESAEARRSVEGAKPPAAGLRAASADVPVPAYQLGACLVVLGCLLHERGIVVSA